MRTRQLLLFLTAATALHCGSSGTTDAGDGGALADTGSAVDTGVSADTGSSVDAGSPGDTGVATDAGPASDTGAPGDGGTAARDYDTLAYGADGAGLGGARGAPYVFDVASRYANDAAFRANIANYGQSPGNTLYAGFDPSKAPTGDRNTALYIDGVNPDLAEWMAGAGPGGQPALVLTIKGLNQPSSSPTPELAANAQGRHSLWLWVRRRYDPGYSSYGDADDTNGALTWNRTQGAGLKIGPYAAYGYHDSLANTTYYGRAGLQSGNGQPDSTADYDLVNLPQGSPQPAGVDDTRIGRITTEWTDGQWRDYLVYVGNTLDSDGVIRAAAQVWERAMGGGGFTPVGTRLTGDIGPATSFERPTFNEINAFMLNANLARKTDEHSELWAWAAFDAEVVPDPYGVLGP